MQQQSSSADRVSAAARCPCQSNRFSKGCSEERSVDMGSIVVNTALGGCVRLHYELYTTSMCNYQDPGTVKVLFVMGMGATATCWQPQIEFLLAQASRNNHPLAACAFDNRGVGRSSSPQNKQHYSSSVMAADAAALMDHLSWPAAHIVGFSMGTQIASKLAAMSPSRVQSLTLIAAVGGRWHVIPRSVSAVWAAVKCITAKTPEQRAAADLKLHFTPRALRTQVAVQQQQRQEEQDQPPPPSIASTSSSSSSSPAKQQLFTAAKQKHLLVCEYVTLSSSITPQPPEGAAGQVHAVWNHKLTSSEKDTLSRATFPKLFIHGRHDLVAPAAYAHSLAERLGAPFVELPGAHFVTRESSRQVNALLAGMVFTEYSDGSVTSPALMSSKDAGSLHGSSSMGSICALHPHEEHLVVRPITPTLLQYRKDVEGW